MNIAISAGAGRWSDQQQNLTVPQGSTVVFYVADGGILSNDDGYAVLANLQAGNAPGGDIAETVSAGSQTYDYSAWYSPEFATSCGIYNAGSNDPISSLELYTEGNPLLLSRLLAMYPNCTIYWVCCREIAFRPGVASAMHVKQHRSKH